MAFGAIAVKADQFRPVARFAFTFRDISFKTVVYRVSLCCCLSHDYLMPWGEIWKEEART